MVLASTKTPPRAEVVFWKIGSVDCVEEAVVVRVVDWASSVVLIVVFAVVFPDVVRVKPGPGSGVVESSP